MHVQHFVGKWNEDSCEIFWAKASKKFKLATVKYRFNVCTDGNKQNQGVFKKVFPPCAVNYGKVKKISVGQIVVGTTKRSSLGHIPIQNIDIKYIDGYCSRLRERVSRFCRRAKTYSKKRFAFESHLDMFQAYNNFMDISYDKKTPCMIEKITDRIWEWDDIFFNF